MKYMRRKLRDVKHGDLLVDIDGMAGKIVSKTPVKMSDEVYSIVFKNQQGKLKSVKADGNHLWPMAAPLNGSLPEPYRSADEMTTRQLYEMYVEGHHAMLSPAYSEDTMSIWQVYSACISTDREVQCVSVDSPTHTFLIASDHDRDSFNAGDECTDKDGVNFTRDKSYVVSHSVPTHNCGGPLALDARLDLYGGGHVTMKNARVGDVLITEGNKPTTITETSPVMMADSMYEIEFEDVADDEDPDNGSD